jgi:hypothetical protein
MSNNIALGLRAPGRGKVALFALAVVSIALSAWSLPSARAADVVRVEEDWVLVIGEPDPNLNAPQVSCGMSPVADFGSAYVVFNINHRSQPVYVPGGLQLQVWNNNSPLLSNDDPDDEVMSQTGETVTWTQQMTLTNGTFTVAIVNGNSQTWGTFGGDGRLQASLAASFANLNGYSPNVSVSNSGVSFAPNRVQSLTLKCVRYYTSDGQVIQDNQARGVASNDN